MKFTPEQKANQLIEKFGKDFSILIVDEIIEALEEYDDCTEKCLKQDFDFVYISCELQNMDSDFRYWNKVKNQIKNKS